MSQKLLRSSLPAILAASAALLSLPTHAGTTVVERLGDRVVRHMAVCDKAPVDGARCNARIVVGTDNRPIQHATPSGLSPSDLRDAYVITGDGSSSTTIAIVDAYGYSNAESDLAVYRSQFGLPACTTANGCFKKVNQNGVEGNYPSDNTGWSQETALDLDMASAICPDCSILLVEASSSSYSNLSTAVETAASMGAHVISNSYGGDESSSAEAYESAYDQPGIAVTVSSGDDGYGVEFPASSPHVIAVGGTTLEESNNSRGWTETVWDGTGSGCSTVFSKPSWQTDTGCSMRTVVDVAAVADPATGVAVYAPITKRRSSWLVFGGTSAAAPIVGGVYAVNGGTVTYGSNPYDTSNSTFDVTSGSNGSCSPSYLCNAQSGYDGPTGLGTPNGSAGF